MSVATEKYFDKLPRDWLEWIVKLNNFVTEHPVPLFIGITLYEQIQRYKVLQSWIDKEGLYVISVFESCRVVDNTISFAKWVNLKIREHKAYSEGALVEPLPVQEKYLGCRIRELYTPRLLSEEGFYNKHCVGGYVNKVNNNLRIFVIEVMNSHFTCEILYDKFYKSWKVNQCKSYANSVLSEYPMSLQSRVKAALQYLTIKCNDFYNPASAKEILGASDRVKHNYKPDDRSCVESRSAQ